MISDLRDTLLEAIRGDKKAEHKLVTHCARMAEAYVRTKAAKHDHLIQFSSASYPDFALDSIADLFKRTEGVLVVFESWYERVDGDSQSTSDLFMQLRRLVFSSVNDHIFATYKQMDSSLSKIIRNLKRGITEHDVDGLELNSKDQTIQLKERANLLREIGPEIFEIKLSYRLSDTKNMLEILQIVRAILEEYEPNESGKVKVTGLATIIRRLYSGFNEIELEQQNQQEKTDLLKEEEWSAFIKSAVKTQKVEFHNSYVVSEKLSDELYNAYFYITEEILLADYLKTRANNQSFFEHLNNVYPKVSKEEYRTKHRVIMEYFVKKTRGELKRIISKEISSAN